MAKKKTLSMAICYDFDGTLAPGYMQEYDFIPAIGVSPEEFWAKAAELARKQDADPILAYMRLMLKKAAEADIKVTREAFRAFGSTVSFFPGVEVAVRPDQRLCRAERHSHRALHHILGTPRDDRGQSNRSRVRENLRLGFHVRRERRNTAVWPALAMNYTTKTQFLFARINKGNPEVYDNSKINKFVPKAERPVPFDNIIYIGDGETDIPCFQAGQAGGRLCDHRRLRVLAGPSPRPRPNALFAKARANIIVPAEDYSEGSIIDSSIRAIDRSDRGDRTDRIRRLEPWAAPRSQQSPRSIKRAVRKYGDRPAGRSFAGLYFFTL